MKHLSSKLVMAAVAFAATVVVIPARAVEISFYYPIAVSGPLTKIIDGMAADFEKANPGITVKPIYSGNYGETLAKALTANKSGQPPQVAVLTAADALTVIDEDAVIAVDGFLKTPADKAWLDGFFPAFMMNGRYEGKTYGVPFQRSTQVLYWNKAAFREAGLDPNKPPANWDELVAFGKKLTVRDSAGNVTRWGLIVPSGVTSKWFLQGFTTPNQAKLTNEAGNETYLATPAVVESLQYFVDLSRKHKIMQEGIIDTGTAPKEFIDGRAAIMHHSTGNLVNVKNNAKFEFGVAMLPARKQRGSATGGGSIYIFKKSTPEQLEASFKFVKWMTSAEQAAKWSIETGYVAPRQDAWDLPIMKKYLQDFPPAGVALEQLPFCAPEFSTHDGPRTVKALEDAIEASITGTKTPAKALADAQAEATRILRSYKR
ncbi:MAG: ABC transporter substrate-binding protein [Betaproteobacteria bacterium]|nr:ABC transporter substrate-binding protein [Betaproteobacteria bacterium]